MGLFSKEKTVEFVTRISDATLSEELINDLAPEEAVGFDFGILFITPRPFDNLQDLVRKLKEKLNTS